MPAPCSSAASTISARCVPADAWKRAGNECEVFEYVDGFHGFTGYPIEIARRAHTTINQWLAARVANAQAVS